MSTASAALATPFMSADSQLLMLQLSPALQQQKSAEAGQFGGGFRQAAQLPPAGVAHRICPLLCAGCPQAAIALSANTAARVQAALVLQHHTHVEPWQGSSTMSGTRLLRAFTKLWPYEQSL